MGEEGGKGIDPRIVDSLKRNPRTEFGQHFSPGIAEKVAKVSGRNLETDMGERIVTEEAVEELEDEIIIQDLGSILPTEQTDEGTN